MNKIFFEAMVALSVIITTAVVVILSFAERLNLSIQTSILLAFVVGPIIWYAVFPPRKNDGAFTELFSLFWRNTGKKIMYEYEIRLAVERHTPLDLDVKFLTKVKIFFISIFTFSPKPNDWDKREIFGISFCFLWLGIFLTSCWFVTSMVTVANRYSFAVVIVFHLYACFFVSVYIHFIDVFLKPSWWLPIFCRISVKTYDSVRQFEDYIYSKYRISNHEHEKVAAIIIAIIFPFLFAAVLMIVLEILAIDAVLTAIFAIAYTKRIAIFLGILIGALIGKFAQSIIPFDHTLTVITCCIIGVPIGSWIITMKEYLTYDPPQKKVLTGFRIRKQTPLDFQRFFIVRQHVQKMRYIGNTPKLPKTGRIGLKT